jgi:hypothetical protein
MTIPAGEIANERPIVVSSEVRKSSELGLTVHSRQLGPRKDETLYKTQNVSRTNPAGSLFAAHERFKIVESKPKVHMMKSF